MQHLLTRIYLAIYINFTKNNLFKEPLYDLLLFYEMILCTLTKIIVG